MILERKKYLEKLIKADGNALIKVITGLRRVGKTFLLFDIFKKYLISNNINQENIIEIRLDEIEYEKLRNRFSLYEYIKNKIKNNNKYYIFIDEIQFVDNFVSLLNSLLNKKNLEIYITGSNSKFLSSDIITEFRGRSFEIRINPFTFSEFIKHKKISYEKAINEYITYGSMPYIMLSGSAEEKEIFLNNLYNLTYKKDIIIRYKIKNEAELDELIKIISSNIGSYSNPNKLSNIFKSEKKINIASKTIDNYLKYLQEFF